MLICDETRKPCEFLGAHDDVVALRRAEEQLRQREAELSALLAKSEEANTWLQMAEQVGRIGHWRVSLPDCGIAWSNEVFRILGVNPDYYKPTRETVADFYHPDDRDRLRGAFLSAFEYGTPFDLSVRLLAREGETRHVQIRGITQKLPDGTPSFVFGVIADITRQVRMEQALREANERLERIAHVDVLTGLANRRRFDETLEREWRRALREHTTISLIMLDIDRFKLYNDTYGHPAGDECLRRVAAIVARLGRRPADLAARYGGEEMALILPATSAAGAEKLAREACEAIADMGLAHAGNGACGGVVTASFGVASALPCEDKTYLCWTDLLDEADRMLYEAKRIGRNRVVAPSTLASAHMEFGPEEEARLAALDAYDAAGATRRSREMDRIARLAATLTGAPIALVSLVGRDRQSFAGNYGLPGVQGTPREVSFCAHTILGEELMLVADATRDVRFRENELVTGELGIRYYAGAPIISQSTGHTLGALCVIDRQARAQTSAAERAILTDLANMAAALLEEAAQPSE